MHTIRENEIKESSSLLDVDEDQEYDTLGDVSEVRHRYQDDSNHFDLSTDSSFSTRAVFGCSSPWTENILVILSCFPIFFFHLMNQVRTFF